MTSISGTNNHASPIYQRERSEQKSRILFENALAAELKGAPKSTEAKDKLNGTDLLFAKASVLAQSASPENRAMPAQKVFQSLNRLIQNNRLATSSFDVRQ